MGRPQIPLKFRDAKLVRTMAELKSRFQDSYTDIIILIEGGEMERFLHGQAEDEKRDLIKKMKSEGVKPSVIARELSQKFGVECPAGDDAGDGNDIVSSGSDIKAEFESDKPEVVLVRGEWKCSQCIEIRSAKKISGQGESASMVAINGMGIDIPKRAVVEIRNLCIRNTGEDEAEIRIAASKVKFVGVRFEGVRIEAVEGSTVSLHGCSFTGVKQAIHGDAESKIDKGDTILGAGVVDDQHEEQVVAALKAIFDAPKATTEAKCRAVSSEMVDICERLAESGNPEAQRLLGECYKDGIHRKSDAEMSVQWCRKAADQGDAFGQAELGAYYCFGIGIQKDEKTAVMWFRKAAAQGEVFGQYFLGLCYLNGLGMDKNEHEAVNWLLKAAEEGNPESQNTLGDCYSNGIGVNKDEQEAVKWYRKAAEQGNVGSLSSLGGCYFYGRGVGENQQEAVQWYRKAAEQGDVIGQLSLSVCFLNGLGLDKDWQQAVEWCRKAADQGDESAQKMLKEIEESHSGCCPHGHGKLGVWSNKPRCYKCGWPDNNAAGTVIAELGEGAYNAAISFVDILAGNRWR